MKKKKTERDGGSTQVSKIERGSEVFRSFAHHTPSHPPKPTNSPCVVDKQSLLSCVYLLTVAAGVRGSIADIVVPPPLLRPSETHSKHQ